jgi:TRAP-type C4-dicarboxylate transport system permease small subunit
MSDRLSQFESYCHLLSKWFNWVAGIATVGMLVLVTADVIGVKLFKSPIPGAIELVGFLGVTLVAFATAYTLLIHGHIQIDYFILRLPMRPRAALHAFVSLLNFALFAVVAWQSFAFGRVLQQTGEVSMTQRIVFYPFVYGIALSSIPVCLVVLAQMVESIRKAVRS